MNDQSSLEKRIRQSCPAPVSTPGHRAELQDLLAQRIREPGTAPWSMSSYLLAAAGSAALLGLLCLSHASPPEGRERLLTVLREGPISHPRWTWKNPVPRRHVLDSEALQQFELRRDARQWLVGFEDREDFVRSAMK